MANNFLSKSYPDAGLLIIRIGIGALMIWHGWPKITGGVEKWESLGKNVAEIGITFFPVFWGFCAALAETLGGLLVITGIFFRPALVALLFTMFIAVIVNMKPGDTFGDWSEAAEIGVVCFGLLVAGAGKYVLRVK